jgi:hypothetical protein
MALPSIAAQVKALGTREKLAADPLLLCLLKQVVVQEKQGAANDEIDAAVIGDKVIKLIVRTT